MSCIEKEFCNQKLTQQPPPLMYSKQKSTPTEDENLLPFPMHFIQPIVIITTTVTIVIIQLLGTENNVQKSRRFCTFLEQVMGSQASPKEVVFSPNSTKHQAEAAMALGQYLYQK